MLSINQPSTSIISCFYFNLALLWLGHETVDPGLGGRLRLESHAICVWVILLCSSLLDNSEPILDPFVSMLYFQLPKIEYDS